jgi:hypothetical protein
LPIRPTSVARIAIAVGRSIATVAVFETNAERIAEIRPNAMTVFAVLLPTQPIASIRNAKRRATPCWSMAWAMMNAPMKTKTVEDPNGARMSSAGPTPSSTRSAIPMRPPTGIGTASLIHRQMTSARTAASVCWSCSMPSGRSRTTMSSSGARTSPIVRRPRSKRSSAGESRCSEMPL